MIRLSVNINKVATLRNARGGRVPSVMQAFEVCLAAGAPGITLHCRADERHIRRSDVLDIAYALQRRRSEGLKGVELNLEGDPRAEWLDLVLSVRPDQCTLVPVMPGEITSQAGWLPGGDAGELPAAIARLRAAGIRVSLFVDPTAEAVRWAKGRGADRVELYTEPFARAFERGLAAGRESLAAYADAARLARELGLGVNAGHDLDLENLVLFRTLPHLEEVSIGHALISHALWVGLDRAVGDYLAAVGPGGYDRTLTP